MIREGGGCSRSRDSIRRNYKGVEKLAIKSGRVSHQEHIESSVQQYHMVIYYLI